MTGSSQARVGDSVLPVTQKLLSDPSAIATFQPEANPSAQDAVPEGEAIGEGLAEQDETGSVTTWIVIGGGVLLLLVTITGLVLVKNAGRASNR